MIIYRPRILQHQTVLPGARWYLRGCAALLLGTSLLPFPAHANPEGGAVVGGVATITASGKRLDIHQSTDRAVIDWRSFDIEVDEHTTFHQPSSSATALNRVNSPDPSQILGTLTANGNVILVNPNGVFFGQRSVVDVNGLIATSADIDTEAFMAGSNHFDRPGRPDATIINEGTITAKEAGLIGLVAPNVINSGIITAKAGRVHLASGDTATLDFYGDGLLDVAVRDEAITAQLVANHGTVAAEGGTIALTAAAARNVINSLIVVEGELKAPSVAERDGKIIIAAAGSNDTNKAGASAVIAQNTYLDASGRETGEQGGSIEISGDHIALLDDTTLDASGHSAPVPPRKPDTDAFTGSATLTAENVVRTEEEFLAHDHRAGGSIKVGGDYLGTGDTQRAKTLYVSDDVLTLNDAIENGDAGRTIFWSDETTTFNGLVLARGGIEAGHGGFLETSGKINLAANGYADLTNRAEGFNKGTYLLDPADITIYGNVDPRFVATDSSIDLDSDLAVWMDLTDPSAVTLLYSTDSLSGATITGTAGTNIITTSLDVSTSLAVGARIRIGAGGAVTTADTLGADTYTITNMSGTTLTVAETLTTSYAGSPLRRGLVSGLNDQSANNQDASQVNQARMPLWIDNGYNGMDIVRFEGGGDYLEWGELNTHDNFITFGIAQADATHQIDSESAGGGTTGTSGQRYLFAPHHGGIYAGAGISLGTNGVSSYEHGNSYMPAKAVYSAAVGNGFNSITLQYENRRPTLYLNDGHVRTGLLSARSQVWATRGLGYNAYGSFVGKVGEAVSYAGVLSDDSRNLVNQYQSAKWGIELAPPGTGATEASKAMASDGYGVFTTRYLERLSDSADIVLAADNSITLDFQGDTLDLADDRSLSLTTTNGSITDLSAGTIRTTRTGTGGNISLTAGGTGSITLDTTNLEALGGGLVNLSAAGGAVNVVQSSALNLGAVNGQSIALRTTGTSSNISLNSAVTATGAGNALTLAAGGNFINNAGSSALSATSGRWLVYSTDPTLDTIGGLSPNFRHYLETYDSYGPGSVTESGNGLIYSVEAPPLPASATVTLPSSWERVAYAGDGLAVIVPQTSQSVSDSDNSPATYQTESTDLTDNYEIRNISVDYQVPSLRLTIRERLAQALGLTRAQIDEWFGGS